MISRSCIRILRAGLSVPEYAVMQNLLRIRPVIVNGSSLTTVASNSENGTESKPTIENEDLNAVLLEKDKLLSEKDKMLKDFQVFSLCNKFVILLTSIVV